MRTEVKWFYGFCIMALLCWVSLAAIGQETTTWGSNGKEKAAPVPAPIPDEAPVEVKLAASELQQAGGLSFRERRKLGLTRLNILRTTGKLVRAGVITKDTPVEEARDLIVEEIIAESPKAWADPRLDWDAVMAFLERLVTLLVKLLPLFI